MSEFQVVLFNTIKDGFTKEDVIANLAKYLKVDAGKAEILLQRPESVVKKRTDSKSASKYKMILDRCGIGYEIRALSLQPQDEGAHQRESSSEGGVVPVEVVGEAEKRESKPIKLYTPLQVVMGTFFGGPVAATYFIKQNYDAVFDTSRSSKTLIIGSVFSLVFLLVIPFIPEWVPGVAVYMPYLVFVSTFSNKHLVSKNTIVDSDEYVAHSSLKVFLFSILIMALYMVLMFVYMFGLAAAGLIAI